MLKDYNVFEHPTVVELLKDMTAAAFRSLGEPGDTGLSVSMCFERGATVLGCVTQWFRENADQWACDRETRDPDWLPELIMESPFTIGEITRKAGEFYGDGFPDDEQIGAMLIVELFHLFWPEDNVVTGDYHF